VGEGADVGADGEGDSGGELPLELANLDFEKSFLAGGDGWRGGVLREVFEDGEGGQAGMCFSRMRRMVSSLSWVAWSIDATPACAA